MKIIAEYIWLDGTTPTAQLRSKTKILDVEEDLNVNQLVPPMWGFDGSSTNQAGGETSDCVLTPVKWCLDPLRTSETQLLPHLLVLCEVYLPSGQTHPTNTRALLRELEQLHLAEEFLFGIEQEYTLFKDGRPLGFPREGFPHPQGKYYCGVGADRVFGREIVEEHMQACLKAGLQFEGINAEVMPGQWEFQIGAANALTVADDVILARWLLMRITEKYDVVVNLEPKPVKGDWNGSGAHTNFSTKAMRESANIFVDVLRRLKATHDEHIAIYGDKIHERLTGKHETCDYKTFRAGVSDRGASIRIPWHVDKAGRGYIEDRRPCANIDPYQVLARIIQTVGGVAKEAPVLDV